MPLLMPGSKPLSLSLFFTRLAAVVSWLFFTLCFYSWSPLKCSQHINWNVLFKIKSLSLSAAQNPAMTPCFTQWRSQNPYTHLGEPALHDLVSSSLCVASSYSYPPACHLLCLPTIPCGSLEIVQFLEHSSVLLHQGLCSVVSLVWHVLAWEVCELTTASLQISCRCDMLPLVPCLKCLVCPNPILISTPSSPNPVFILIFE